MWYNEFQSDKHIRRRNDGFIIASGQFNDLELLQLVSFGLGCLVTILKSADFQVSLPKGSGILDNGSDEPGTRKD